MNRPVENSSDPALIVQGCRRLCEETIGALGAADRVAKLVFKTHFTFFTLPPYRPVVIGKLTKEKSEVVAVELQCLNPEQVAKLIKDLPASYFGEQYAEDIPYATGFDFCFTLSLYGSGDKLLKERTWHVTK